MGRPKAKIDWDDVGEMLKCGCDASSIAIAFGISTDTLYTRSKVDNKLDFSAFSQQKRAQGDDLLRRRQFEIAMRGNIPMLIWLGKNRLQQSDKQEIKSKAEGCETKDRLESVFRHSKRVYEAIELRPNGLVFDPQNPEHRKAVKESIRRSIKVQKDLYPEVAGQFEGWEDAYEKVKEAIWHDRHFSL